MIVTLHSYKGGTGKTLLSVNLAMTFANLGKKVCLLDLDLRAPSLSSTFNNTTNCWINNYLNKSCKAENILSECTPQYIKDGHLFVGLANPSTEAIRDMSSKDRKWEMEALGRLLSLKEHLLTDMNFDYVVCDSSPGLQYSSINAIVIADVVLVVTSVDKSDVDGTQRMIRDLYDLYEKKTGIVVNKVPQTILSGRTHIKLDTHNLPIIDLIPCSCDVLQSGGEYLFAFEKKEHPITQSLSKIAMKIRQF
ncbi:MAG: ParA family protein [Candidatus Bathyarchaeota archaeon]|nr:ParA family protein [Candidatus Bathyarchaeum sp.]